MMKNLFGIGSSICFSGVMKKKNESMFRCTVLLCTVAICLPIVSSCMSKGKHTNSTDGEAGNTTVVVQSTVEPSGESVSDAQQQGVTENNLIGKALDSNEFLAQKFPESLGSAFIEGGGFVYMYATNKNYYVNNQYINPKYLRIFLVEDNIITDELIFDKNTKERFSWGEIYDKDMKLLYENRVLRYKVVNNKTYLVSSYISKNGKFAEKPENNREVQFDEP